MIRHKILFDVQLNDYFIFSLNKDSLLFSENGATPVLYAEVEKRPKKVEKFEVEKRPKNVQV